MTLVGNDSGGALCQLVATRRPERIGALVLTSCDAFDNFPPKALRPLKPLLSSVALLRPPLAPARVGAVAARAVRDRLAKRPIDPDALESYALPAITSAGVRRDLAQFVAGMDSSHTLAAAERLPAFDQPGA